VTRAVVPGWWCAGTTVVNLVRWLATWLSEWGGLLREQGGGAADQRRLREDCWGPVRVTGGSGMVETDFSLYGSGRRGAGGQVYKGLTPLTPEDVADTILWAVKRLRM